MDQNNTPDSWDQAEDGGSGDIDNISGVTKGLGALNVNAAPFVPGQNVFAKEFVPSFLPQNTDTPSGEIFMAR